MNINKLFKNRYFLSGIQFFSLIVFGLLIYGAIGVTAYNDDFAKILRNTNLANLIVWSYWWPLIIVTAIFFGRFWCSVCPMELVTSFFGKIGFRKKPGRLLKSGWVITMFYAIILILGIHTFAIHRIPQYMAIYLFVLFIIALASGLVWEKRTFCTYICPIGHLLGLYSLLSIRKLRVINSDVCSHCKTKDCISKTNQYKFTGRSCTSELYPATISDNRSCILCGQCHKSCTKGNIAIKKQGFVSGLFSEIKLSWAEITFFIILSGFVVYEILSEWGVSKNIILVVPDLVNHTLGISAYFTGTIKAFILFVILPLVYFFIFVSIKKIFAKENWKNSFTQLVLAILPVTASMHLLKAILKTTSRIPYWEYSIPDPKGVKTAQLITENAAILNKDFFHMINPYIGVVAVLLSVAGIAFSLLVIRKQKIENNISRVVSVIAVLVYSGIFLVTLVAWRL